MLVYHLQSEDFEYMLFRKSRALDSVLHLLGDHQTAFQFHAIGTLASYERMICKTMECPVPIFCRECGKSVTCSEWLYDTRFSKIILSMWESDWKSYNYCLEKGPYLYFRHSRKISNSKGYRKYLIKIASLHILLIHFTCIIFKPNQLDVCFCVL